MFLCRRLDRTKPVEGLRKLAFARKRNLGFLTTAYRLIGTKP
jgi:hypothetical protein